MSSAFREVGVLLSVQTLCDLSYIRSCRVEFVLVHTSSDLSLLNRLTLEECSKLFFASGADVRIVLDGVKEA